MAASKWFLYDNFMLEKSNGTQDMDTNSMSVALMLSTYAPNLVADALWSAISSHQIALANGYGGPAVVIPTLSLSSGNVNFNTTNATWTASGGDIVARYAVLKNDTTGGLIGYTILDDTPADVTVVDGNVLTIDIQTNTVYDETRV